MLPAGIALGEVMVASVGRGVALERSSLTCWSTIARACFMVGVIGAACLLSLLCWLSWSDIVSSDRGWDGCEERRKRGCRGGPGGRCSEKESEESRVWYSKYVGCFIRKKEEGRKEGGRVAVEEGGIYGGAAARMLVRADFASEVT